jgi:ABC-type antimicrobial peptide transport system permease subunit
MKRLKVLVLAIIMLISMGRIVCAEDAYMGFSVSDGWYVFSRDMKDTEFLKSLDLTTAEVNEILDNSGCRYLLSNPAKDCEIYVKVSENDLSYDLYNLAEQTNEHLMENLRKILYDGFTMKGLNYNDAGVVISDYPQMKFVTVPGSTFYDDKKHGIVFGGTVVNGSAVGFTMYLENEEVHDEDIATMQEVASTVTFTVIKDKTEDSPQAVIEEESQNALEFMVGGFGAIVLIVFCVIMIEKLRHKDKEEETEQIVEEKEEERA